MDKICVLFSLIMDRGWANVHSAPPKLVFDSQNAVPRFDRFRGLMDAPAQTAGSAIEGQTEIAENDVFVSAMCDIPAGSGGLSAASENASAVSPFCAAIVAG